MKLEVENGGNLQCDLRLSLVVASSFPKFASQLIKLLCLLEHKQRAISEM